MIPLDKLFESFLHTAKQPSGEVVSLLLSKKARKKLKKAAKKSGGAAAIASLGYFAFQKWQHEKAAVSPPNTAPSPSPPSLPPVPASLESAAEQVTVSECLQMNMILAMISAAGADGKIDEQEIGVLVPAIEEARLSATDKAALTRALNRPPTLEEVAAVAFSPMEACELYGAALSAIEVDTPAEQLFLRRFAAALKLGDDLIATIRETVEK